MLRWDQTQGYDLISFHRPTLMPAARQMLLLKQHVLLAILSSPGAYLCLNWAMGESKRPLTKVVELIYRSWHLANAEAPSPIPSLWTSISPACCLWMTHLSSLSNPAACLRSPMKTGRVTHIRDAAFSSIKRFAFELPTVDKKFELSVLTSKCQVLESQNPKSSSWMELCSGAAPFAQQHLLSCSGRHRDCKAQFASHFEIRAMTQFVTFWNSCSPS